MPNQKITWRPDAQHHLPGLGSEVPVRTEPPGQSQDRWQFVQSQASQGKLLQVAGLTGTPPLLWSQSAVLWATLRTLS